MDGTVVNMEEGAGPGASPDINDVDESCDRHAAMAALDVFNTHLASRPLTAAELTLFLASLASFNRHTIGGIAILAGRLSDEILPLLPTKGHEIGAYVLDAAVDEYGLRETVTHVESARSFAAYLGISAPDVEARSNACASAVALGDRCAHGIARSRWPLRWACMRHRRQRA